MGVAVFTSKDKISEGKQFLSSVHSTFQRLHKNGVNGCVIFVCRIQNLKSNRKCVPLLANNKWFSESDLFYAICVKVSFGHPVSTGLKKEMDFVCGTLSLTVKCLSIFTPYKNLDLLSWSVFSYKTIDSTEVINSCKTYSCKTWGMAFRGNEGSPITAKWNLIFFFRAATSTSVTSLENILWSAHVQ